MPVDNKIYNFIFRNESTENNPKKFPKKLRCVSGKDMMENKKRVQNNYYETDSSTSDSENEHTVSEGEKNDLVNLGGKPSLTEQDEMMKKQEQKIKEYVPISEIEEIQFELEKKKAKKESEIYFKALEKIKGKHIPVLRLDSIEAQRSKLPIHAEEQQIVEAINENTVNYLYRV